MVVRKLQLHPIVVLLLLLQHQLLELQHQLLEVLVLQHSRLELVVLGQQLEQQLELLLEVTRLVLEAIDIDIDMMDIAIAVVMGIAIVVAMDIAIESDIGFAKTAS